MYYDLAEPQNREIKQYLQRRLRKRSLILASDEVEAHGEHYPDMPFRVWICLVKEKGKGNDEWFVVLYPKAVYWIDSPSDWYKPEEDSRIFIET